MAAESPAVDHLGWKVDPVFYGRLGVNLNKPLEALESGELARMTNVLQSQTGGVQQRDGLASVATLGANIHSAQRMNDPLNSTFTRFWGVDGAWGRAQSGAITSLESGFSGNPLSFVSWQSELTGTPWMYVADANKMRKASMGSNSQPIGIAKPAAPAVVPSAIQIKNYAAFDASDGTNAAAWSTWSGRAIAPATGNPGGFLVTDTVPPGAIDLNTQVGTIAGGGYYSAAFLPKILDLSTFPNAVAVADDDLLHLTMLWDRPDIISEVRLYFVVGNVFFSEAALPGDTLALNTSAYMRAFTPAEYSAFIAGSETAADAASAIQQANLLTGSQNANVTGAATPSAVSLVGANKYFEFGIKGLPVRRGEFLKVGLAGNPGLTWANVVGIVVSVSVIQASPVRVSLDYGYFQGGGNLDSSEPDSLGYDYRVTNYSKSAGAESNPSDAVATTVDVLRGTMNVTPVASGNPDYIQRFYRRGGSISDDWYFAGANAADGALFTDNTADITALAAGAVDIDHDQPVTTTDQNGNAVFGQPLAFMFGPIENYMVGGGDPYRPGDFYWCKQNEPDHWPAANHQTACPPGEQLMNGGKLAAGQAFLFSRQRLYSVTVSDSGLTSTPTECAKGLAGRWAYCVGVEGIWFVAKSDGVYITQGGAPVVVSDNIRPLLRGQSKNGYNPVDWTQESAIRLSRHQDELWFGFQDTAGARVWWVYHVLYKTWRFVQFSVPTGMVYSETNTVGLNGTLLVGGVTSGAAYTHDWNSLTDAGVSFLCNIRTGADNFGAGRAEKLLGDLTVWGNFYGASLTLSMFLNGEKTAGHSLTITGSSVYDRYIADIFGTTPQHAISVTTDLQWGASSAGVSQIAKGGVAVAIQPEVTMNRATTWEPMNDKGENYLMGCWIDSDTGGTDRTINVEGLLNGHLVAVSVLTVNSSQGRRQWFSWPAVHVDMIRLRPAGSCDAWMLFGQGWLATPEPPRIAVWDSGFENLGDSYATGLDLEVDTFGVDKTIAVTVDGVAVSGSPYNVNGNGRKYIHLSWTPVRGHIFRFSATDGNVGLLYMRKWLTEVEPGEQTNWNQNYTIAGTHADKWLKGILLECDTFGLDKTVTVEIDGVAIAGSPFTVNTSGRKVVQVPFAQSLGRVFRILPTDANPGRLYSMGWIFDEEPYQLTRFETQEQPNGIQDFQIPVGGQIAIKSTAVVNMQVLAYGQGGAILFNNTYVLPSTGGNKGMISLQGLLTAQKGLLYKFVFTSAQGFWLYREESWVDLQPWRGGQTQKQAPFGNDDLDATRTMRNSVLSAERSGGSLVG